MKSRRLEVICDFLAFHDRIIDIGCDHAYVAIEMARRGAKKILATDIHPNALKIAQKNIQDAHFSETIETQLADGLSTIDTKDYQTLVIAGMGTSTICHILSLKEKLVPIQKIILQTNRDFYELRKFMQENNFTLKEEKVIFEENHYYPIMKYIKGKQNLSEDELEFGFFQKENISYYQFLKQKYCSILEKIPQTSYKEREKYCKKIDSLNCYIAKCH